MSGRPRVRELRQDRLPCSLRAESAFESISKYLCVSILWTILCDKIYYAVPFEESRVLKIRQILLYVVTEKVTFGQLFIPSLNDRKIQRKF